MGEELGLIRNKGLKMRYDLFSRSNGTPDPGPAFSFKV
jgi:hypothetical protein